MFKDKILLITGGTGSFGNAVVNRFLHVGLHEIRIFSRDEKKQDDMRKKYLDSKVKFYIGDVRDSGSIQNAMKNVNYVFHAAALKQVPSCEFFPLEAVKTNVLGTENVLCAAISEKVERVVCLSTDKAAYPINAMGMSKALMEKVAAAKARENSGTIITCTRYGNVMCSRGSVIPLFIDQIKAGRPLTITNPEMTRFMMSLDEAMDLVIYAFQNGNPEDLFIQKASACSIGVLAEALLKLFRSDVGVTYIGGRHGEKLYETLATEEECLKAEDLGNYLRIPADNRDLNYEKYLEHGIGSLIPRDPYTSHNTRQLSVGEVTELLSRLEYVGKRIV